MIKGLGVTHKIVGFCSAGILLFQPMLASAKCGGVDYSWGADALANAHDYTVTMMLYVPKVLYNAECWRIKSKIFQNKNQLFFNDI